MVCNHVISTHSVLCIHLNRLRQKIKRSDRNVFLPRLIVLNNSPLCTVTLMGELLEPMSLLPTHMYVPASDILMLGMSRVPMSVRACRRHTGGGGELNTFHSSVHSDDDDAKENITD